MFNHNQWLDTFHAQPGYNDALAYGVTVTSPPNSKWRVLGIHHLTGNENNGNHNIYFDVLDKDGYRINGARIQWGWEGMRPNEHPNDVVVDKPPNEAGANLPVFKGQRIFCSINSDASSDTVSNLSTEHPDEDAGNTLYHHSFFVAFQEGIVPKPPDPPAPGETVGRVEVLANIEWLNTLPVDENGNVAMAVYIKKDST